MKLHFSSHALVLSILFVFLLSINTTTSARTDPFLLPVDRQQSSVGREEMMKMDGPTQAVLDHSGVDMEGQEEEEAAWNLMGMEQCNDGDEECLKRRLMSEAHLDYIYTQKHKP
ncbi:putative phytosulfokines 6 [Iris pallida]|uniref:Phytosulfokine n=1 Tax=Iris pallida TaxID=29817 RepID=A0AAX6FYB5_IRIPA|nr:putative phytosulfokines 6 [Iris pallida]